MTRAALVHFVDAHGVVKSYRIEYFIEQSERIVLEGEAHYEG